MKEQEAKVKGAVKSSGAKSPNVKTAGSKPAAGKVIEPAIGKSPAPDAKILVESNVRRGGSVGSSNRASAAPTLRATVGDGSPITNLVQITDSVSESVSLMAEALRKIGIFHTDLCESDLYSEMEGNITSLHDGISQFQATDGSALAAIYYANATASRLSGLANLFVNGDCGSEDCDNDEDRTEYAADKIYIGRRLGNVYTQYHESYRRARRDLDLVSIAIFGNEVEVETAAGLTSDEGNVGIQYMLEVVTRKTENLRTVLQTLTYRINESF